MKIYKCMKCGQSPLAMLESYCYKCKEEIFKVLDDEQKGIIKCNPDLKKEYGCIEALKLLEFGFSLGLGKDKDIHFNGNCQNWTNSFHCSPTSFEPIFDVINFHETFTQELQSSIEIMLKKYPNRLFLCKDRDNLILEWHYYHDEQYNNQQTIPFSYKTELPELEDLNEICN